MQTVDAYNGWLAFKCVVFYSLVTLFDEVFGYAPPASSPDFPKPECGQFDKTPGQSANFKNSLPDGAQGFVEQRGRFSEGFTMCAWGWFTCKVWEVYWNIIFGVHTSILWLDRSAELCWSAGWLEVSAGSRAKAKLFPIV